MFEDIKITINGNKLDLSDAIAETKECDDVFDCHSLLEAIKYELEGIAEESFDDIQIFKIKS